MKNKVQELTVVGSGLSSLIFIDAYLEKNKKVDVISFKKNFKVKTTTNNNHIFKILPPQMIGEERPVLNYFDLNKIVVNKKNKFFGALEFGGLSNYWGLQIDKNIMDDIKFLSQKTQKKIYKSFTEIFQKLNLIGKYNKDNLNPYEKNEYISHEFFKKNKDLFSDEPILAFQRKKKGKIKFNEINEKKDKLTPRNFYNRYLKKKNITFHNYFVESVKDFNNLIKITCSNGKDKKIFFTKKLVLGCGTLVTTKLIMDYLNIKKEVKINHHPRLFSMYISKKPWKNKMEFQPSHLHLKSKKNPFLFTADFRPGDKVIVDAIIKFKYFLAPFKLFINLIRENLIFSNVFIEPKYGNLYLKNRGKYFEVYSKVKNLKFLFKKISKIIFNFLKNIKKIFPFYINYFPGFGADFHYFGTILMGKKGNLSVNEKCQLNKNNKIYLIDGSVLNFKKNKYPLGLIMANSRRVGKEI